MMSPLITRNDLSFIFLAAFLIAPPVPSGLFSIENDILIPNFSEFEKRAFKTRVGNTSLTAILQKELNLCLPKEISASEMLDSIDPSLPTEKAMLKALQDQKKRLC
mgnify:CR=1 FL=1